MKIEFFNHLYSDPVFCTQLGKVTLAAGRFESNLCAYLALRNIIILNHRATLGVIINKLEENKLITKNGAQVLRMLKRQRNYLTHSLFDLFSERVGETLLTSKNLLPSDVDTFTNKAWELEDNLIGLNDIVEQEIQRLHALGADIGQDRKLLFTP